MSFHAARIKLGPQPMFAARPLHAAKADISGSPRDVAEGRVEDGRGSLGHAATPRSHRRIAQPKATFVTSLQPCRLPDRAARQLPDQSTTLRVDSSSTDDSRLRGALPLGDILPPFHISAKLR